MPQRLQRRRTRGWRTPEGAVYVGRPTRWGNPFAVGSEGVPDRSTAVERYRAWLGTQPALVAAARAELAGRDLLCWCPLGGPCHADVLLAVADDVSGGGSRRPRRARAGS